jgi:glutamine cyclotransferase
VFSSRANGVGLRRLSPTYKIHWPALQLLCLIIGLIALCLPIISLAQLPVASAQSCGVLTRSSIPYATASQTSIDSVPVYRVAIIARYPHDRKAFTQGLVFYRGNLYESTGIRGRSSVRKLGLETGQVLKIRSMNKELFGEGLTVLDQQLVQLTWQSGLAFIYAPTDLRQTGSFTFSGDGWGITGFDGQLVISDGSSRLRFLDSTHYQQTASLHANVWKSDCIAQIDPDDGRVVGWLDLAGLFPPHQRPKESAVANGIAYDPVQDRLFVTGKYWPYIYQIKVLETVAGEGVAHGEQAIRTLQLNKGRR